MPVAMRVFSGTVFFACSVAAILAAGLSPIRLSGSQQKFSDELGKKFVELKSSNINVAAAPDGWLFFVADLRLLSTGKFWGELAQKVAPSRRPDEADPAAAILDFYNQLKLHGIELVLVPVPPKAAIYSEKILPGLDLHGKDPEPYLTRFYDELRENGVQVVDLASLFIQRREGDRGPVFCRTDTHWSGSGCVLAAQSIAPKIKVPSNARREYAADWKEIEFTGDLVSLLPKNVPQPAAEKAFVRVIKEKSTGAAVQPDPDSPVLLMGDSHTLVFHDFLSGCAGLLDQMAYETGIAPDLIGTRGSGASAVRVTLYRRSHKDPDYLAKKKMIVWCFSAREFIEADAWARIPVSKESNDRR
jgi:SGNH hydrolase-like domain, acetyltransferase AlgX